MQWRAMNIKNCLARVNQLPPEILARIVGFLPTERGLISATAVCQHWRTILLSFPRLWWNIGGSSLEIQAYIERSKSTPIDVRLSSPELGEFIAPHTSRLVGLTIQCDGPSSFSEVVKHLCYPIPTLRVFRIIVHPSQVYVLKYPFHLHPKNPFFLHSKKLEMEGIAVFCEPQTFPHVTEFTLRTNPHFPMPVDGLLGTLEQLPVLEKLDITFLADLCLYPAVARVVTFPHLQEMSLSTSDVIQTVGPLPRILEYFRLPKLTSLCVQAMPRLTRSCLVSPVITLSKHLPNFAELPELQVNTAKSPGEVTFRRPSQAVLKYLTGPLADYNSHELMLWRELPLHSVRRLIVDLVPLPTSQELEWLGGLLHDLKFLEHLEFGGGCGRALRWLRHETARGVISLRIRTLTIRHGGNTRRQAVKLKRLFDAAGLKITLIYIPDPGIHEERDVDMDTDGSSDDWDENDGSR